MIKKILVIIFVLLAVILFFPQYFIEAPKLLDYINGKDCIEYYYNPSGRFLEDFGVACEGEKYYCQSNNQTCYREKGLEYYSYPKNPLVSYFLQSVLILILIWILYPFWSSK